MVNHENGVWTVTLGESHTPYKYIRFKRGFEKLKEYKVVIVSTEKFMDCYSRDNPCFVIPSFEKLPLEKQEGIRHFLDPNDYGEPEMPFVGFELASYKKWLGSFGEIQKGVASFFNGRHRSRYMQYAGAACFPVEVHVSEAEALLSHCGCKCCN